MDFILLTKVLGIPFLVFVLNALVRYLSSWQQSSAADLIVILIGFDLGFLADQNNLVNAIIFSKAKGIEPLVFTVLLIISLITWYFLIAKLEKPLTLHYAGNDKRISRLLMIQVDSFPVISWILSWGLAISLMAMHLLLFTVKTL